LNSPAAESAPRRPLRREIIILVLALLCGIAILPVVIFWAGSRTLGTYAGGDLRGFMTHFFAGLGEGSFAFWAVALGPYVVTVLLRLILEAVRRGSSRA
jgi:hypothetical protein